MGKQLLESSPLLFIDNYDVNVQQNKKNKKII